MDICRWRRCRICSNAVPRQGGNAGGQHILSFDNCIVLHPFAPVVSLPVVTKHTKNLLALSLLWTVLSVLFAAITAGTGRFERGRLLVFNRASSYSVCENKILSADYSVCLPGVQMQVFCFPLTVFLFCRRKCNRKPQTSTACIGHTCFIQTIKFIKQQRQIFCGNGSSFILNRNRNQIF